MFVVGCMASRQALRLPARDHSLDLIVTTNRETIVPKLDSRTGSAPVDWRQPGERKSCHNEEVVRAVVGSVLDHALVFSIHRLAMAADHHLRRHLPQRREWTR